MPPESGPRGRSWVGRRRPLRDVPLRVCVGPPGGQHMQLQEGSQGPLGADCAALRGVASRRAPPGPDVWLLLRRPARTAQLQTYLMQGPADMTRAQLVGLAAMRGPIETCFQAGQQLLGLGDYERRSGTGLASPHDPVSAGPFLPGAVETSAKQKPLL